MMVIDMNIANGQVVDFASYGFEKILFVSVQPKSNAYTFLIQNAIQSDTITTFVSQALVNGSFVEAGANTFKVFVVGY